MKVIFSRKGFDSSYGGFPSIILPKEMESKMISFPIPETNTEILENGEKAKGLKAEEINFILKQKKISLKELFEQLGIAEKINIPSTSARKGLNNTVFHFDPELQTVENMRSYAAFGQSDKASSHLLSHGLQAGDVFLFFGSFKKTFLENNRITYDSAMYDIHAIWGYMIVDDIVHVKNIDESLNKYPDIKSHLHYQNKGFEKGENIIICGSRFGTFNYEDKYRLTKLGYSKTIWELPDFFKGANISYCNTVTDPSRFKSAEIGQEFVVTNFDEVKMKNWLNTLGIVL